MTKRTFGLSYERYYAWLLTLGMRGAVVFGTSVAIAGSVLTTAIVMLLIPGPKDFFWYGMIVAVVSPALTAPGLGSIAFKMAYQLNKAQAALTLAAETDALTGVFNRRSFMAQAELAYANARAGGAGFSVVMIDIDHFKAINDTHGHSIGDMVLRDVARSCSEALRGSDCFARFGGEEFIVLLHMTAGRNALNVAEILRKTVANLVFEHKTPPSVTVSLGVAGFSASSDSLHDILNEADRQLYAAKAAGRNRVMAEANPARVAS